MSEVCMLDLDNHTNERRYIKIAGEKIDITKVPAMSTMLHDQVIRESQEMKTSEESQQVMEKSIKAILVTVNANNNDEKINREWLLEHCEYMDLVKILIALHGHIKKKISETALVQ